MSKTPEGETVETDAMITPASLEESRNEFFKSVFAEYPTTGDIENDAVITLAWLLWKKHRYRADKKPIKPLRPSRAPSEEDPMKEYWAQLPQSDTPKTYSPPSRIEDSAFDNELLFSAQESDEMRILAVIDACIARVSKRLQHRFSAGGLLQVAKAGIEFPDQNHFLSEVRSQFAPNTVTSADTADTLAILLWRKSRWHRGLDHKEKQKLLTPPSRPTLWQYEDPLAPYIRHITIDREKRNLAFKFKITEEEAEDTVEFKELKAKLKREEEAALAAAAQHVGDAFDKDDLQQFKILALVDIEIDRCLSRLRTPQSSDFKSWRPFSNGRGSQHQASRRTNILNVFN